MSGSGFEKGGTAGFIGSNVGKMLGFGDPYVGPSVWDEQTQALMDKVKAAPERGLPDGATVESLTAGTPTPWQGTPWAQMDPAYQAYVKSALGGSLPANPNLMKGLERGLGAARPNETVALNPYQQAAQSQFFNSPNAEGNLGMMIPIGGSTRSRDPLANALWQPMPYAEWQALRLPTSPQQPPGPTTPGAGTPGPTTPDSFIPNLPPIGPLPGTPGGSAGQGSRGMRLLNPYMLYMPQGRADAATAITGYPGAPFGPGLAGLQGLLAQRAGGQPPSGGTTT